MANLWTKFRAWPKWAQIVTWVVVGFIVLAAIVPDAPEEVATVAPSPTSVQASPATTEPPTTELPTTVPPTTTTTEPPGPATSFEDGTYEVGVDIEAGTYRAPNEGGGFCYVDVRDGLGQDASFMDQQVGEGPKIIEATEGAFVKSSDCGTWSLS